MGKKKAVNNKSTDYPNALGVLVSMGSSHRSIGEELNKMGYNVRYFGGSTPRSQVHALYEWADAVLLTGGADIHPFYYGQKVAGASVYGYGNSDWDRDQAEFEVALRGLADAKPMMGICRGHQMIAVAAGGSLVQHVPGHQSGQHEVLIYEGRTRLGEMFCVPRLLTNSLHHQVVRELPKGWVVSAVSDEGYTEAMEHVELPVLSVQWHPELLDFQGQKFYRGLLSGWTQLTSYKGGG